MAGGTPGQMSSRPEVGARLPFCSVVVPAYNAAATLPLCLVSLARLDYPCDLLEVFVVDNGSEDASAEVARSFGVTLLSETGMRSSYAARNVGIRAARGELIAFTDADCIVTPGWLRHLTSHWDDQTVGCFAGEIESYKPQSLVEQFSDRAGILRQRGTLESPYLPYAQTANAAYRKSVFDRIGFFVQEMTSGGDADIAWRMQRQLGLSIKFIPEALVYHKHRTSIQGIYHQYRKYERGKFDWTRHYPDYPLPTLDQRRREFEQSVSLLSGELRSRFAALVDGAIDCVDYLAPFFRFLMAAGTYHARLEITRERDDSPSARELEEHAVAAEAERLSRAVAERDALIRERDELIGVMRDSLSWRLTAPLRRGHALLARLRR